MMANDRPPRPACDEGASRRSGREGSEMTRTRVDVWTATRTEGDWPAVLEAYERAVGLLHVDPEGSKPTTPTDWRFLAAMHGIARLLPGSPPSPDFLRPDTSNEMWCMCQHESWFFFPWHRMYLLAFEQIVQHVLGDDQWSLPYWVAIDPDDPTTAVLPPAFRDPRPGNNLRTPLRSGAANAGMPIGRPDDLADLSASVVDALRADVFSTPNGLSTYGGGERSDPSFSGGRELGLMEGFPHGSVHVLVGGRSNALPTRRGWMGSPYTAALDPIFWLHHSNIDRLWETWLNDENRAHRNPVDDDAWAGTEFTFPAPEGQTVTWKIRDVLDTAELGYVYESIAPPSALVSPEAARPSISVGGSEEGAVSPVPPDVVGVAADVDVSTDATVEIELAAGHPSAVAERAGVARERIFLRIEGVRGRPTAAAYNVYLNAPEDENPRDHPELRIGALTTFGMAEASQVDDLHDGTGLTSVFDITAARDALISQQRWDPTRLRVTFRPIELAAAEESGDGEGLAAETPDDVRATRISVISA
jgi:tyrosinase